MFHGIIQKITLAQFFSETRCRLTRATLFRHRSGAENGAERTKKSDESSRAVSGSRKRRAERGTGGHGAEEER